MGRVFWVGVDVLMGNRDGRDEGGMKQKGRRVAIKVPGNKLADAFPPSLRFQLSYPRPPDTLSPFLSPRFQLLTSSHHHGCRCPLLRPNNAWQVKTH